MNLAVWLVGLEDVRAGWLMVVLEEEDGGGRSACAGCRSR
jgi:hypothetical protein